VAGISGLAPLSEALRSTLPAACLMADALRGIPKYLSGLATLPRILEGFIER
jgi:hypothetical protein